MNQRGFSNIIAAVVVLLVVIAVGGYFVIQQYKTSIEEPVIFTDDAGIER